MLAHGLVHDARGGGIDASYMPAGWVAVVVREEHLSTPRVARRLVPPAELLEFIAGQESIGANASALDVALEFDVPEWIASRALSLARGATR